MKISKNIVKAAYAWNRYYLITIALALCLPVTFVNTPQSKFILLMGIITLFLFVVSGWIIEVYKYNIIKNQ